MMTPELPFPEDLLYEIAFYLDSHDALSFCLTSRYMHDILTISLYKRLTLYGFQNCKSVLARFNTATQDSPSSPSKHVRDLILEPYHAIYGQNPHASDEIKILNMLQLLIQAGQFAGLVKLVWRGSEPPSDAFWTTLKTSCYNLKYIGTCVGPKSYEINPSSKLLDFKNLSGFELFTQQVVKWHRITNASIGYNRRYYPLPDNLITMLSSPSTSQSLTKLVLDSSAQLNQLWDCRPLFKQCHFPSLRSLRFSGFGDTQTLEQGRQDSRLLDDFLTRHADTLVSLDFTGSWYHSHLSGQRLPCSVEGGGGGGDFPKLESFRGRARQISGDIHLPSLREIILLDYFSPKATIPWLADKAPELAKLGVCVNLQDSGKLRVFLGNLLPLCPNLKELTIYAVASADVRDIASQISTTPSLQNFALIRKDSVPSTNELTQIAKQLRDQLQEFTIVEVAAPHHEHWLLDTFRIKDVVWGRITQGSEDGKKRLNVRQNLVKWPTGSRSLSTWQSTIE